MFLHVKVHREAQHYRPINLDTFKMIPHVIAADEATGFILKYKEDTKGNLFVIDNQCVTETKVMNVKLVDTRMNNKMGREVLI